MLSTLTSGTYLDCLCPVMFSWRAVKNHDQVQAVVALAVVAASEAMCWRHIAGCECEGGLQRH